MKTILFVLLLAFAFAAVSNVDIGVNSSDKITLTIAANSGTATNYDVTLAVTAGTAITATQSIGVAWVDTGKSDYDPVNDTTASGTFGFIVTGASGQTDLTSSTYELYGVNSAFSNSTNKFTATAGDNVTAITGTWTPGTTSGSLVLSNKTAANLATLNLPNSSQTFYWQCFFAYDVTAIPSIPAATLDATFATSALNVTLSGASSAFYLAAGLSALLVSSF